MEGRRSAGHLRRYPLSSILDQTGQEARPMRTRMAWLAGLAGIAGGGLLVFSQTPSPSAPAPPAGSATRPQPVPARPAGHDLSRLTLAQRQLYVSAQCGADWLRRSTRPDGRFGYVATPALRLRNDTDHYLRQAGAACAL